MARLPYWARALPGALPLIALLLSLLLAPPLAGALDAYQLGNGDKVRVTVFGENDLSGTFVVDGKGGIAMPLIGQVHVGKMDLRAAERAIEAKLKDGFLKRPRVSIEVLNFRPFYILGEVKSPGSYPYVDGMSMLEAVAVAGGFTYRAKKDHVMVKRVLEGATEEVEMATDAKVFPGDILRIEERFF